ncbi:MAG: AmmeMemoRadiSam system protein A [Thermodesulfobacteriota bacterium]
MTFSSEERDLLFKIAREAIASCIGGGEPPSIDVPYEALCEKGRGAFVSLHKGKELRGCIGSFGSPTPLYETISDMAVAAATTDPRFEPLTPEELREVTLEISVLTPLKKIGDVSEIEVGRDGIYIMKGANKGVLLPQVATEYGWEREQFLDHTCLKAGLKPGEWKDEGVAINPIEAEIFSEQRGGM